MRKAGKGILLTVNILAACFLILSYLSCYISPAKFWTIAFFGLAYPYLLVTNLIFLIIWAVFRSRYIFISFIVIAFGWGHLQNFIQLFPKNTVKQDGLRILSYNVQQFYSFFEQKDRTTPQIIQFLVDQDPDIICMQEVKIQNLGPLRPERFKAEIPKINYYHFAHTSRYSGSVTFSKYPIVNLGEIRFVNSHNLVIYSDIKLGKDTVRVYNCHLQSNYIKPDEYSVIDSARVTQRRKQINEIKDIGTKLKRAFIKRAQQTDKVAAHIAESPYPVIICGDFNSTPVSYTYKTLRGDLKDSFVESGSGICSTYRGRLPAFRIDYILHDDFFSACNFSVKKIKLSDHYPITCVLERNSAKE
ncbi:MAG: endonuclease/exonuclease/phosphatase family protein [Bacteroidota bacterium]|nr:endonuclease/exonuclease/phosphatase family protein [Bacteroidota bacterium]MDP4206113.1 endonuclease/exonuclease/phosphatase family protein [Bacteroidota bacterium]